MSHICARFARAAIAAPVRARMAPRFTALGTRLAVAAPTVLVLGLGGALLAPAGQANAAVTGHVIFGVAGTTTWTVPAGVTGAIFTLDGGAGGSETTYLGKTSDGGKGGQVSGFLTVTAGQTYTISVGGQGESVQGFYNSAAAGGTGGLGGGGDGGSGDDPGAGGGGASDVILDNNALFMAAGGGGAVGSSDQTSPGGDGGGLSGGDGSVFLAEAQYGSARGGTQTQGGAVGRNDDATGESQGYFGLGGHGGSANPTEPQTNGGGGGGGGLYGGGGGGSSGGGGGSSYLNADASKTSDTSGVNTGGGYVNIDYGAIDTPTLQLPGGMSVTAGQPFAYQVHADGWPTPDIVAVGGSLPSWLTLAPDGTLSGTTTKAGLYSFRLAAEGPSGETSYDSSVDVLPATGHLTIDGITPTTVVGTQFAGTAVGHWADEYGNGIGGVSFFPELLTDGPTATFENGTDATQAVSSGDGHFYIGVVTAGPTPGNLDLAVAYAPFQYARVHLTITPANAQAQFGSDDPPPATVDTPYAFVVPTSGWPTPSVSLIAGTLPPGLTLAADGTLSGTPTTAGSYSISLMASNGFGNPATRTTIVKVDAPAPGAPTIGSATAGNTSATVSFTPPASHGSSAITGYTVTATDTTTAANGGQTATGMGSPITISGLTNGNAYTFTVTARNSSGNGPASNPSNTVTPTAPLTVTTTSLANGTVGGRYTATLTAAGGVSPYTWSLAPGNSLPAGLTLHADGTITGSPTTVGARSVTVTVTDAANPARTATHAFTLTVNPAPRRADLAVSNVHQGNFVSGKSGLYRLNVTNTGTATTTGPTTLTETLPRGLSYTLAYGSGWTCRSAAATGTCTHTGALAPSATSSVMVLVHITAPVATIITTTATVAPTDTTPTDNTSTDRVTVSRR
jgi:hypothetical protein